jgi:hypothetical protein
MSVFEALMLLCFGASWPFSIAKTLRTKQVAGKSRLFLVIVFIGYLCGITHKIIYSPDWIMALYIFNALLVGLDMALYIHFARRRESV